MDEGQKYDKKSLLTYNFTWNDGIWEWWNDGMLGNIASGGPRFVVAGRDKARPSRSYYLPVFQSSSIPLRTLRHAIGQLREDAVIRHNGKRGVGSRYFIRHKDGK
jgi:hypothetical protein